VKRVLFLFILLILATTAYAAPPTMDNALTWGTTHGEYFEANVNLGPRWAFDYADRHIDRFGSVQQGVFRYQLTPCVSAFAGYSTTTGILYFASGGFTLQAPIGKAVLYASYDYSAWTRDYEIGLAFPIFPHVYAFIDHNEYRIADKVRMKGYGGGLQYRF